MTYTKKTFFNELKYKNIKKEYSMSSSEWVSLKKEIRALEYGQPICVSLLARDSQKEEFRHETVIIYG